MATILTAVKEYIIGVAQKYELYRYIRFNTVVDRHIGTMQRRNGKHQ